MQVIADFLIFGIFLESIILLDGIHLFLFFLEHTVEVDQRFLLLSWAKTNFWFIVIHGTIWTESGRDVYKRQVQQSTGIGLYLCKRLCEKLGIGITAESSEHGTAISLSFHINCLIHEVQNLSLIHILGEVRVIHSSGRLFLCGQHKLSAVETVTSVIQCL